MQVQHKINDKITIVVDGDTQLDVFQKLARMGEVFGETHCAKCKKDNISFRVRNVKDGKKEYNYPELVCNNSDCRAKLTFGTMEGGELFPVRFERNEGEYVKDKNGKNVPKGTWGWVIYNRETGKEE